MKLSPGRCVTLLLLASPALGSGVPSRLDLSDRHGGNAKQRELLSRLRDSMIDFFHRTDSVEPAPRSVLSLEQLLSLYDEQLVLRFSNVSASDKAALAGAVARLSLDIWAFEDDFVDIRLHSDFINPLLHHIPKSLAASHSVLISDLAAAVYQSYPNFGPDASRIKSIKIQRAMPQLAEIWRFNDNFFFQDYQPLEVIIRWMQLLEAMFPSHVEYISIGKSFEGREIPALRVRTPNPPDNRPRKAILVTGGFHGREWISTSTVNYLAWSYVSSFGFDRIITKILTHFDIVFVPVVNPDSFEYTWSVDRLWRKSRQSIEGSICRGIDLDHAFSFGWNSSQTQGEPCSGNYGGEAPFQAVEASQLADWARNETQRGVRFMGLLDLHSYSQQVLFPYSYSCDVEPPNLENLEELAAGLAKAIRLSNGVSYSVTSACRSAMTASAWNGHDAWPHIESGGGSAIDWFYHELGAHFSYQIKLRDTGNYGFLLPKEYIIPTGEEMLDAMKYYGDYLLGNNGIEKTSTGGDGQPAQPEDDGDMSQSQEL